jgi:hypothetical protein
MCKKDIPYTAVKCKYCGAVFDNRVSTSWGPSLGGHVHRDHRGTLVLGLGVTSVLCCFLGGALLGPFAFVMGVSDLYAMSQGRMDTEGQIKTAIGMILGAFSSLISFLGILMVLASH